MAPTISAVNTPAHLVLSAALFAREGRSGSLSASLCGALAPDLSLYVLTLWHLGVAGTSADIVFRDLYYSDAWQSIFAIDNSVFVYLAVLALAARLKAQWLVVFSVSALVHIAFDLPLHAGDGRPHFWPLSLQVIHSPVSYWDERYLGWFLGPAELVMCAALTIVLFLRYRSAVPRALFALLLALEVASSAVWYLLF